VSFISPLCEPGRDDIEPSIALLDLTGHHHHHHHHHHVPAAAALLSFVQNLTIGMNRPYWHLGNDVWWAAAPHPLPDFGLVVVQY